MRRSLTTNDRQQTTRRGFTLVETLVALSILITAITATLGVASSGLSTSILAKEQITAFYLAQDAIEYIKNLRDRNAFLVINQIPGNSWANFRDTLVNRCGTENCEVDTIQPSTYPLPSRCGASQCQLKQNPAGLYSPSGSTNTSFTRNVRINRTSNDDELEVSVTILWKKGVLNRSFKVTEYILDWQ